MARKSSSLTELLGGGDRRSLGRVDEAVRRVLRRPRELARLVDALCTDDPVVRMRAADALEKVSTLHPEWLQPHKAVLLREIAAIPQSEVRWHVALMVPRLALTARERVLAETLLRGYLADESRIVKTCAMQALADLALAQGGDLSATIALMEQLTQRGTPAMKARGRKLLPLLRTRQEQHLCGARCPWACGSPEMRRYHDEEWGVPSFDDRHLFEMLVLEGAQAGLSWSTILRKREAYRRAFDGFDPHKVAAYGAEKIAALLADPGIVRNRLKIAATVNNAQRVLELQREEGSLAAFLWRFVDGQPRVNRWRRMEEIPTSTPESDAMSRALAKRGFRFVGSTICYAFMQAVGMVNDHLAGCPSRPGKAAPGRGGRRGQIRRTS